MASLPFIRNLRETRYALPVARQEWLHLANWALIWVVLANAGFALMWLAGAPPRVNEILITGLVGLFVRHRPVWLQLLAFLGVTAYSVLAFVSGLFNLDMSSLVYSLRFFAEIDPIKSIEYVIAGTVVLILIVVAARALRRDQGFTDLRVLALAVGAVIMTAQADKGLGGEMLGHYNRKRTADSPFISATSQVEFASAKPGPPRHLLIIMVESLGTPVGNREMDRLLFHRYRNPQVAARFEVSRGTTPYFNSTTAGEMRELCGRWGEYHELLNRKDESCLPAHLRERGYQTSAYHSFVGAFFDRATWYPNIGFDRQTFAPELLKQGARECGGIFPGACDRDVPELIALQLRNSAGPQFIYWLTVNSHLPVPPGLNLNVDRCDTLSPMLAREFPMICRQFAIWDALDAALVQQITAADFPPTDILIVGDHMPPYFDRSHRKQFAPDHVPYLYLRWKDQDAPVGRRLAAR